MKRPFDLEQFKSGKKAVTRGGDIAICGGHNPDARETYEVLGWIGKTMWSWDANGKSHKDSTHHKDLIGMAPEKKTVWVKVATLLNDEMYGTSNAYSTKENAKNVPMRGEVIGTFPLEIEV